MLAQRGTVFSCLLFSSNKNFLIRVENYSNMLLNDEVLISKVGCKRILQLNRPKMRNAYNPYMIQKVTQCLEEWQVDSQVKLVIVKGHENSFSSGGEIANVAGFGDHVDDLIRFNYSVHNFSKPYVALVNGLAMGGGLALATNGQFVVVTEKAIAAMPEVIVGYYPDAAAAQFLKGNFGLFMAMTGFRINGADIYHANLATHYTTSLNLLSLEQNLLGIPENQVNKENVKSVLSKYQETVLPLFTLKPFVKEINESFSKNSVEQIMESLRSSNTEFGKQVIKGLQKISPTSLKVTFQHFRDAKYLNFEDLMLVEHRLTQRFVKEHDFYEVLIDKDRNPKWNPSKLEDVTQTLLDSYFMPEEAYDYSYSQYFFGSKL